MRASRLVFVCRNGRPSPQHIVKCHGSTLLPQFLGMYRVSVDSEETYLIVMRNMFSHRIVVHRKYDLKVRPNAPVFGYERLEKDAAIESGFSPQGSLVDREASDKERVKSPLAVSPACHFPSPQTRVPMTSNFQGKELPTFKDVDFRNNMQKVYVTEEQKEKFMEKLNRDVEVSQICPPDADFVRRRLPNSAPLVSSDVG